MKEKSAKKAAPQPPPRIATAEDVLRAIDALTDGDFLRLNEEARFRIVRIGRRAANGRTKDDLLQESITRLLDGTRNWYPDNVAFGLYLMGVIRSIASEWAGHRKRNADAPEYAATESDLTREDEDGNRISPFDSASAHTANVEQQALEADIKAERKALADEIEASCADDEDAAMVILGWQSDLNGPAIQNEFGWTETKYRTTVRRIKRRAQRIAKEHYGK